MRGDDITCIAIRLLRLGNPYGLLAETPGRIDGALPRLNRARLPQVRRSPRLGFLPGTALLLTA